MKRFIPTKLMVRRETLRALTGIELMRALGGEAPRETFSGAAMCPAPPANTPPGS